MPHWGPTTAPGGHSALHLAVTHKLGKDTTVHWGRRGGEPGPMPHWGPTGFPGSLPVLTSLYKLNFLSKALLVLIFAPGCLQVLTPWAVMNHAYEYLLRKKKRTLECLTKVQNLV